MKYKTPRKTVKTGPEAAGARRLMKYMRAHGWGCRKLHGGKYSPGWPDYYCHHPQHGHRWVETKAKGGKVRPQQIVFFNWLNKTGDKVYILEDETHYYRLFKETDNWKVYIR